MQLVCATLASIIYFSMVRRGFTLGVLLGVRKLGGRRLQ